MSCPRPDSGPDDPISQPTNRGNKMRANAEYVREGALGYINAEEFYREVRGTSCGEGSQGLPALLRRIRRLEKLTLWLLFLNRKLNTPVIRVTYCSGTRFGMIPRATNLMRRMRILRPTPRQPRRTLFQGSRWKVSDAGYEIHSTSRIANEHLRSTFMPLEASVRTPNSSFAVPAIHLSRFGATDDGGRREAAPRTSSSLAGPQPPLAIPGRWRLDAMWNI